MKQVKLFKGVEKELSALESSINSWIAESNANVQQISGNIAPQSSTSSGQEKMTGSDILVIVEYEKS